MSVPAELESHVRQYAEPRGLNVDFVKLLGFGQDGMVWRTHENSAIKAFERYRNYTAECGCYQRLALEGITEIDGLSVPRLVGFDESLMVIEIGIVKPPYILDFGKAYLDEIPPYTPEQLEDWEETLVEFFGDGAPRVRGILRYLKSIGIHYLDTKPGNIVLTKSPPT